MYGYQAKFLKAWLKSTEGSRRPKKHSNSVMLSIPKYVVQGQGRDTYSQVQPVQLLERGTCTLLWMKKMPLVWPWVQPTRCCPPGFVSLSTSSGTVEGVHPGWLSLLQMLMLRSHKILLMKSGMVPGLWTFQMDHFLKDHVYYHQSLLITGTSVTRTYCFMHVWICS